MAAVENIDLDNLTMDRALHSLTEQRLKQDLVAEEIIMVVVVVVVSSYKDRSLALGTVLMELVMVPEEEEDLIMVILELFL